MAVYNIIPETNMMGGDLSITNGIGPRLCRRFCDDDEKCKAFVWTNKKSSLPLRRHDKEICILKRYIFSDSLGGKTYNDTESVLYIKKGNSNYWILWVFIGILSIILFVGFCPKK